MNAALGNVSAGGIGIPVLDVTQSGGGPRAFVANQSGWQCGWYHAIEVFARPASWEERPGQGVGLGRSAGGRVVKPTPRIVFTRSRSISGDRVRVNNER